ncbi:hypothetical protein ES703_82601 [subsurface metagenome]
MSLFVFPALLKKIVKANQVILFVIRQSLRVPVDNPFKQRQLILNLDYLIYLLLVTGNDKFGIGMPCLILHLFRQTIREYPGHRSTG